MQANPASQPPTAILEHGYRAPKRGKLTSRGERISITATMREMVIGTSFIIDDQRHANTVYATAHRLGVKVSVEKTPEGARVHRIA